MKEATKTMTKTNTKEAYQMVIDGYTFYGAYTYGGWQTLSAIANALQKECVMMVRVFVKEDMILLGE